MASPPNNRRRTVTESVVLPPDKRDTHAADIEADPVCPALVADILDWHWRNRNQFAILVDFGLVYLAGLH
jgi:hypothetical protein